MATDIVGGLFGVNPTQYQQQQQAREFSQDYQMANLTPLQQSEMAIKQGARAFGRGVGGLMGMEDPELAKASQIKQIASQFDLSSPDGLRQLGNAIKEFAPQEAMQAIAAADEREKSSLGIQKTKADITKAELSAANEEKLRAELSAAVARGAQDNEIISIVSKYGSADKILQELSRKQDRADARAAKGAGKSLTPEQIEAKQADAQIAVDTVQEARNLTSEWSTGYGSVLAFLPKSDARKLQGKLDTIKSNLAAAMIEDLKSQSRTGATGLGALNKEELKVLQTSKASLDSGMGADELQKSLNIIDKYFRARANLPQLPTEPSGKDSKAAKPGMSKETAIKLD